MWVYFVGEWFETQNTGAQAFGVFFFVSVLAILTVSPGGRQSAGKLGRRLSAIVLFAVLAVAHLLASLIGLGVTAALYVSRRVRSSNLVILAAVFIGAWSIYGAVRFLESRLPRLVEEAFRLDVGTQSGILNPLSGSEAHAAVAIVRIAYCGLFVAVALLGGILAWRLRKGTYADITMLAVAAGSGCAAIAVGAGYAHELYQRIFVFLLPVIAYFAVKLLRTRATAVLLCVFLFAALPLTFVARYGNQTIDYLSPAYLAGASFFDAHTTNGHITGGPPLGRMRNYEQYRRTPRYEEIEWRDHEMHYAGMRRDLPWYVCISNLDRTFYTFYLDKPRFFEETERSLSAATNCDLVFADPDVSLYLRVE
jgi:hypothetical protein